MPTVIRADEGKALPGDFEVVVKVRGEHTNGITALIEETVPPKRLVTPYTHENDVWVCVLTGEIGILVGDEISLAGPTPWVRRPLHR